MAGGRAGHRVRARAADAAGRDPLGPPRRRHAVVASRCSPGRRRSATACAAPSPSPSCSATSGPTGSCRRRRWPRRPPRARGLRPQGPLGDGLVLPGAVRRGDAATTRAGAAAARAGRHVRHRRQGHPLRERPAVGHHRRDVRVRAGPPRRGRGRHGPARCSAGRQDLRDDDGAYWTGIVYPGAASTSPAASARPTRPPPSSWPPTPCPAPAPPRACSSTPTSCPRSSPSLSPSRARPARQLLGPADRPVALVAEAELHRRPGSREPRAPCVHPPTDLA